MKELDFRNDVEHVCELYSEQWETYDRRCLNSILNEHYPNAYDGREAARFVDAIKAQLASEYGIS